MRVGNLCTRSVVRYLPLIRRNNRGRLKLMHHRMGVYHPLPIR